MIELLDKTIQELLRGDLSEILSTQVDISFAPPDENFTASKVTLPAVDLFLYDIRENHELRSNEQLMTRRGDGMGEVTPPPVRVDCSYLITAWPSTAVPNPAHEEHRLLGAVMRSLLRRPRLPAESLVGELRNQELPIPTSSLQPGHLQSLAEFWQALGGKPKAALNYTVTIALPLQDKFEVPLVTDKLLRFGAMEIVP
jgi:hypothetical protein